MTTTLFCLAGSSLCYPIGWWGAAAAWAQALLTVATFVYAIRLHKRDWNVAQRERLSRQIEAVQQERRRLEARADELRDQTAELRRQTLAAALKHMRLTRKIRDRVSSVLSTEFTSPLDEAEAFQSAIEEIRDLPDIAATSRLPRFSESSLRLLITVERTADQGAQWPRQRLMTLSADQVEDYVARKREALQGVLQCCVSSIEEVAALSDEAFMLRTEEHGASGAEQR